MKRKITLAIYNINENISQLEKDCNELNIPFSLDKANDYYQHFTILGDTEDYKNLIEKYSYEIITTYHAELGNVADCDDNWLNEFQKVLDLVEKAKNTTSLANTSFHNFIMPIDDINVLNIIEKYSAYLNEVQKRSLRARQDVLLGNKQAFIEEMDEFIKSDCVDVKSLREKTGMTRVDFCKYFDIPYRTVEDWENKKSTCSSYLYKLMVKDLINSGILDKNNI
jgi:DNA-binding transcriptional regulator YiaG